MSNNDVIVAVLLGREACDALSDSGQRCDIPATIVCKFYLDNGPAYVAACKTHMMRVSGIIDGLIQRTILPDE